MTWGQLGTDIVLPNRTAGLRRRTDGSFSGEWGPFELRSAFQPIYTFLDNKVSVSAFEALIRPFIDDRPIPLASFFPKVPLSEMGAVETLARRLHLFNADKSIGKEASLFINFNPSLFAGGAERRKALDEMRSILAETHLHPGRIVCEVTEQESTSEKLLIDFVKALRKEGYRIAVDDYGAASSDILRIESLKPDIVKFDAKWVTRLMATSAGYDLLKRMVSEFEKKQISTVFEGIEEAWQAELARKSGVTMVQGFGLARPQVAPVNFEHPRS